MTEPASTEYKELVKARREICGSCEYKIPCRIRFGERCGKCGCIIAGKVQFRGATCPVGKW